MNNSSYILETDNLTKRFGSLTAVDHISFRVKYGECYGLLGPNGAGKSSTIRMVYGFLPITEGNLTVFGLDVKMHSRSIKYKIGVCQQDNNLDPDLTVLQNLQVFARYFDIPKAEARKKIDSLLSFTALDHRRNSGVMALSGGMKRRLMIARALINDPELLILDEPTTGLDPQSRHQVWEKLQELKSKGLTTLLTTHYMDEAFRLCNRLIIIDHGTILVEGTPSELIEQHVGKNVVEIDEPTEELRAFVKSKELMHDDLGHRIIIYMKRGEELYNHINSHFCSEGCILRMATLEDVFLKLTGRDLRE